MFDFTDIILLKGACQKDRIIAVQPEHPVSRALIDHMKDMDIAAHMAGTLPLIDLHTRRRGEADPGTHDIEPGEAAVALPDKDRCHIFPVSLKTRILRIHGPVLRRFLPALKLFHDGLEECPVPGALIEHDDPVGLLVLHLAAAAREHEFQLHPEPLQEEQQCRRDPHDRREQHASGARIDIQYDHCVSPFRPGKSSPTAAPSGYTDTVRRSLCER